jgi:hypothetical protein
MGVVNLHRKEGGHFKPDLGGQYHRILQSGRFIPESHIKLTSSLNALAIFLDV